MSLFNFVAFSLPPSEHLDQIKNQKLVIYNHRSNFQIKHNLLRLKPNIRVQNIASYSQEYKMHLAAESVYRFSQLNNINTNLVQELINKYWQQTIFLSTSNSRVQKYINQLSKQETLKTKNKKKKLLIDFTKALLYGHIDTDVNSVDEAKDIQDSIALKYVWKKGLNLKEPKYLNGLWKNKRAPNFPTKLQILLLKKLEANNFPLFVVANGFKQLVVAEPADKLINRTSLGNSFYEWYYDRFLWNQDIGGTYEGWFFVNPQDAEEYKNYIEDKYTRSTKQHNLDIISSGMHFYYRLNRTAPPQTEFRLFPDLEEVENLLTNRKYRYNMVFDKNQKYGRSYFQGQPIYMIEPILGNKKTNAQSGLINYYYQIPSDDTGKKYKGIFLNKEIALQEWQNFRQKNSKYNLPFQPILRVYNLEDFLKDQETSNTEDFLLIPGRDSYNSIKSKYLKHNNMSLYKRMDNFSSSYVLTGKLWLRRVIWSLTSRQPPNW